MDKRLNDMRKTMYNSVIKVGIGLYGLAFHAPQPVDNFLANLSRKTIGLFSLGLFSCRYFFASFLLPSTFFRDGEPIEVEPVVDAWDKYGKPYLLQYKLLQNNLLKALFLNSILVRYV